MCDAKISAYYDSETNCISDVVLGGMTWLGSWCDTFEGHSA